MSIHAGETQRVLTKDKVETTLRRFVLERSPWQPEQVQVIVRSFTPIPLKPGRMVLRVLRPRKGITPGRHSFLLAVELKGKEAARVWVRAELKVYGEVVVTSRPLARHQSISFEDVRIEWRDLGSLSTRPYRDVIETIGKQASRSIEVNKIVSPSMVTLPKVIRRGRAVSLVYETSKMKVEALGQAMEDGRVGDVIRVKNPSSGQLLQGRILDGRTVRVNW